MSPQDDFSKDASLRSDAHQDAMTSQSAAAQDAKPAFDTEAIMRQVRAEVARRHVATDGKHYATDEPGDATVSGMRWRPAASRLPDKDQFALADFLGFNDQDFVDVAYRRLLRRPANDKGCREYLDALRSGAIGKVEILGMIRFSAEGRRNAVHVDGLLLRYKLRRWRRRRVIGWFLGMGMTLARLPRLAQRLQGIEASAAHESQEIGRLLNRLGTMVDQRLADVDVAIDSMEEISRANGAERIAHQKKVDEQLGKVDEQLGTVGKQLGVHDAALTQLKDRARDDQRSLRAMLERLTVFLDVAARQQSSGTAKGDAGELPALEAQYASFEDAFRGERDEIKQRVAHYLGTLAAAGVAPGDHDVVLDLGSGRGEWLEVLAEHGYRGRGVDLNRGMLKASEARGHEVVEADVLDYLRAQDSDSFAAITAMHLVEHIPHSALLELLDEALRVLRPGGVLMLETPNPENVRVGSCTFYMDPTHLNPIPPLLLQWIVRARGFEEPVIERLSEHRGSPELQPVSEDMPGAWQINQMIEWFTAPPDYAVIARKPATHIEH